MLSYKMLKWLCISLGIGILNVIGESPAKRFAFRKGYRLSQHFQKYPGWNSVVEPLLIRQFAIIFGVSNSFIQGMLSDNENVQKDQELLKQSVMEQFEDHETSREKND